MSRRERGRRRLGRGPVSHSAHESQDAAPELRRQPPRSAEWSGRDANGSLDERVVGSRTIRGSVLCAGIFPGSRLIMMTMTVSLMDAIVLLAGIFALVFLVAWIISPRLRVWIERPKYRFLADVQSY